jgi:hypothetical protein
LSGILTTEFELGRLWLEVNMFPIPSIGLIGSATQ